MTRRLWIPAGLVVLTLALTVWRVHWAWTAPGHRWAGNPGDAELYTWFIGLTPHAIGHGHSPFFTTDLNYPLGVNVMWNTSVILPGLVFAPVTLLGGPLLSYNLMVTLAPAVNALAAYLLVRRWVGRRLPAALGALAFAFAPFFANHQGGHLDLELAGLVPVIALVLDEIAVRQRWPAIWTGAGLGLLAVAQLLTSEELLVNEAVVAAIVLAAVAIGWRRQIAERLGYLARAGAAAVVVFLVLGAWPIVAQLAGPQRPVGPVQPVNRYVSDLFSPVVPILQRVTYASGIAHHFTGNPSESNNYLGIPLIVLLILAAVLCWRRRVVRVALFAVVVAVVLSFGPHLHVDGHDTGILMPEDLLVHLPLLGNLVSGRYIVYAYLGSAVVLACLLEELWARAPGRPRTTLLAAVAVLLAGTVVTWVPRSLHHSQVPIPGYFTTAAVERIPAGGVAIVEPWISNPGHVQSMIWQAASGYRFRMRQAYAVLPAVHGSSGFGPQPTVLSRTLNALQRDPQSVRLTPDLQAQLLAVVHSYDVRAVLVGPMDQRSAVLAFWTQLLGEPGQLQDGVWAWYLP